MTYAQERILMERRLRTDRRRGFDRRVGHRRFQIMPVEVERRHGVERRLLMRRSLFARRGGKDRRNSGPGLSRPSPSL